MDKSSSFVTVPSDKLAKACNKALQENERQHKDLLEQRLQIELNLPPLTFWEKLTGREPPPTTKVEAMKRIPKMYFMQHPSARLLNQLLKACKVNPDFVQVSIDDISVFELFYDSDHS